MGQNTGPLFPFSCLAACITAGLFFFTLAFACGPTATGPHVCMPVQKRPVTDESGQVLLNSSGKPKELRGASMIMCAQQGSALFLCFTYKLPYFRYVLGPLCIGMAQKTGLKVALLVCDFL
jgi:hypothetical protein